MFDSLISKPSESFEEALSVTKLSLLLKQHVETSFSRVCVRGEVSMPKQHMSGHLYFTLKDENSVLDAVCWRPLASRFNDILKHGCQVVCEGKITTYPGRSKYQIVVTGVSRVGEGDLFRILEERKQKLRAEGLFEPARKKPLPAFPRCVGVITSPTGAVIRDIVHRLQERFPVHVLLYPVPVQGDGVAPKICEAVQVLGETRMGDLRPDVIILARGGGSFEDLFVFNDEALVRAVASCPVPLVSAIGHETDTTLCDFASDCRAPTPTAAAELITPHRRDLSQKIDSFKHRLYQMWEKKRHPLSLRITFFQRQLESGTSFLAFQNQRVDELERRLTHCGVQILRLKDNLSWVTSRLRSPKSLWESQSQVFGHIQKTLKRSLHACWDQRLSHARVLSKRLHMASYKKTLKRGFCLTQSLDQKLISSVCEGQKENYFDIIFHDGALPVQRRQK